MSYHRRNRKALSRYRSRAPMGGLFDDVLDVLTPSAFTAYKAVKASASVDQVDCLNKANGSAAVERIDTAVHNLATNWKPSGKFGVQDFVNMAGWVAGQNIPAQVALVGAPRSASDSQTMISQAMDALAHNNDIVKRWNASIAQARAVGATVIDAPSFKSEVLSTLNNISQAYVTRAVMDCNVTWLDRAGAAVEDGVARAMRIADALVDLAEKVVKAAAAPFDIVMWLGKYGPLAAVGLGGLYIYTRYSKR